MSGMNEAIAPEGIRHQCPACGEPVANTTLRVVEPTLGVKALELQCGHAVTFEMLEQAWGIVIPQPSSRGGFAV